MPPIADQSIVIQGNIMIVDDMPELNGYQVCEQPKSGPGLAGIPVIFLNALTATDDKAKGFQAGGVDYISKQFEFKEVQARVQTHLKLKFAPQTEHDLLEKTLNGAVGVLWGVSPNNITVA